MNFKKILAGVCSCAVMFGSAMPFMSTASTFSAMAGDYEGFTIKDFKEDAVWVTGYRDRYASVIEIPEYLNGKRVIGIDSYAFMDSMCEEVILPDTLTRINYNAFNNCENLRRITLPDSLRTLDDEVFSGCINLEEINGGNNLDSYIKYAFYDTAWFKSQVESVGYVVFNDKILLDGSQIKGEFTIPEGIEEIGYAAFQQGSVQKVVIPSEVTMIRQGAFAYSNIQEVTVLNPDCVFQMNEIFVGTQPVIYGYEGSTAEAFAMKNDLWFESLGAPEVTTTEAVTTTTEETTTTTAEETTTTTEETTTTEAMTTTEETTTTVEETTTTEEATTVEETTTVEEITTVAEETTTTAPTSTEDEELPETGYSKFYGFAQAGAVLMITAGAFVTLRKKED